MNLYNSYYCSWIFENIAASWFTEYILQGEVNERFFIYIVYLFNPLTKFICIILSKIAEICFRQEIREFYQFMFLRKQQIL